MGLFCESACLPPPPVLTVDSSAGGDVTNVAGGTPQRKGVNFAFDLRGYNELKVALLTFSCAEFCLLLLANMIIDFQYCDVRSDIAWDFLSM